MRVLIPSTGNARFIDGAIWHLDVDNSDSYLAFWRTVWAAKRSVIVVDHDIIPTEAALKDLWDCDWTWCAQPYSHHQLERYYGLGCVKFDELLMVDFPDLWQRVATYPFSTLERPDQLGLDWWSHIALYEHGYERHHHKMPVDHAKQENPRHARTW